MIDRGGRCAGHGANIHHQEAVVKYFDRIISIFLEIISLSPFKNEIISFFINLVLYPFIISRRCPDNSLSCFQSSYRI